MKILKGMISVLFVCLSLFCLSSCKEEKIEYTQITPQEAKQIIDTEKDYIIVDARTPEEFESGHIKNAIVLQEENVKELAPQMFPNKDKLILVYCRSGNRSKKVAQALADMGYTNVKEFGGIISWPYETVK